MKSAIILIFVFISILVSAQSPVKAPFFADDIVIRDMPERNQRYPSFCSAFNGYQYVFYTNYTNALNWDMLRSFDDGTTWESFYDYQTSNWVNTYTTKTELCAAGTTTDNLKLWRIFRYKSYLFDYPIIKIHRWNGMTLEFEEDLDYGSSYLYEKHDAVITVDNPFKATGSEPFSVGLAYSGVYLNHDSVYFEISVDGGLNFIGRAKQVYGAPYTKYINRVDMSYARCNSFPDGKYFITWEEKNSVADSTANIFVSHHISGISGTFTPAIKLNDFLPGSEGLLCNPRIACQTSSYDNDSSNLTCVIIADKYDPVTHKFQVVGFYNNQATTTSSFKAFTIGDTTHCNKQADICYNYFDSTFIVTYFDSTAHKIPYLTHKTTFTEPVQWTVKNPKVNDSEDITSPHPIVNLCYDTHIGAVVWSSDRNDGNGVALFDAAYHYYTGIENKKDFEAITCYPNPAKDYFSVSLHSDYSQIAVIEAYDLLGHIVFSKKVECEVNQNKIQVDNLSLHSGLYIIKIFLNNSHYSSKLIIQ